MAIYIQNSLSSNLAAQPRRKDFRMKTAGIIGGIAPESTIQYYRQSVSAFQELTSDSDYPPIVINSIHMTRMLDMIGGGKLPELIEYLSCELEKLHQAGADFAVLASNTPHIVFDALQARSPIPLISIVETACMSAKELGLKRLGIIGTRFTMRGAFYPAVFVKAGITIVPPLPTEQDFIHAKYMAELVKGIILPETREALLTIIDTMRKRDEIDGVILGGTELPLILTNATHNGLPLLDTTKLHVARIVESMFL